MFSLNGATLNKESINNNNNNNNSIKTILREEFGIVSKFNFPQEGKRSGVPLPSYINLSPLTAIFS